MPRFTKKMRILRSSEFQKMRKEGVQTIGRYLILSLSSLSLSGARLGITVSRKYGKAHDRNRFKRIVREAFRLNYASFSSDLDVHVIPRKEAREATLKDIEQEFLTLCCQTVAL